MGRNLPSLFRNKSKELVEVPIFVNDVNMSLAPTNIETPDGVRWRDFDHIEIISAGGNASRNIMEPIRITKQELSKFPDNWGAHLSYGSSWNISVDATSDTTAVISYTNNRRIHSIVGYRKRYAAENFCQEVILKGGAHMTTGEELRVDIATALGKDFVNQDLLVEVYLWNNSGSGTEDWFKVDGINSYYVSQEYPRGTRAEVRKEAGEIYVACGSAMMCERHERIPNSVQAEYISSTKVKLKVWRISALNILLAGGGAGTGFPIYQKVSSETELAVNGGYAVDTSNGAVPVILPSNPKPGDTCAIKDYAGTTTLDNAIIINSYKPIHGRAMQYQIINRNASLVFSYIDDVVGWCIVAGVGLETGDIVPYEEVLLAGPEVRGSNSGTITVPETYSWDDFDRIEISLGLNQNARSYGLAVLTREEIAINGSEAWDVNCSYVSSSGGNRYSMVVSGRVDNVIEWSGDTSSSSYTAWPYSIRAYTKYKPSTQKGLVRLYQGEAQSKTSDTINLEQPITDFDAIVVDFQVGFTNDVPHVESRLIHTAGLIGSPNNYYLGRNWADSGSQWSWSVLGSNFTPTSFDVGVSIKNTVGAHGVIEVRGVNFKNTASSDKVESNYPTQWQDASHLLVGSCTVGSAEMFLCRWASEDTFEINGIIRAGTTTWPSELVSVMKLPSTNKFSKLQYRPASCSFSDITVNEGYLRLMGDSDIVEFRHQGARNDWVMFDCKFVLNPLT